MNTLRAHVCTQILPYVTRKVNAMRVYHLELPVPPSVNAIWRSARNGKVFKTHKARNYQNAAKLSARSALEAAWNDGEIPLTGKVGINIIYVASETSRNRDIDNMLKLILDSLQGVVYENDSQVNHISIDVQAGEQETVKLSVWESLPKAT